MLPLRVGRRLLVPHLALERMLIVELPARTRQRSGSTEGDDRVRQFQPVNACSEISCVWLGQCVEWTYWYDGGYSCRGIRCVTSAVVVLDVGLRAVI